MRVTLFSEVIPPIQDGVCHTLTNLSASLDQEGIPYQVVSGVAPSPELSWRDRVHKVLSVPFALYSTYRLSLPIAPRIDAALDRFAPDILHVTNPTFLGEYALSYGRRRNLPVVTSYHTNYVSYFPYYRLGKLQGLGWWLMRRFHRQCRATYVPSRSVMEELRRRGIPRLDLWQRGVDLRRFGPRYRSEELRRSVGAADRPLVLYVGRLVREKDLADLAAAHDLLAGRGLRFATAIVGDGPMGAELRRRLPRAHFAGHLTGEDLARYYASADLFVFPSTTETFGNVILEAFASGLPVAGVVAGGTIDLVHPDRNGVLARPKDPASLAEAVGSLLEAPERRARLREGALATVGDYDWGSVNRRLFGNYRRVIREHRSPVPVGALELAAG